MDPVKLVAYPLVAVALIYGARFWMNNSNQGTWSRKGADVASVIGMLSIFVAMYLMFSPGGGGQVAYRPVYVNTLIITLGIVEIGRAHV